MVAGSRPANGVGKDAGPSGCRRGAEVPTKPGNAGGGKGPYFWCAWEGGKERWAMTTPDKIRDLQIKLYRKASRDAWVVVEPDR